MSLRGAPKSFRLHIGFFGRRNTGKSSLLNAITRQNVSIVSERAGTTTDPVEKPMELLPLGPVLFIDTAGIDDEGALGALRVNRTRLVFDRTDLAVIICGEGGWGPFEERLLAEFAERKVPIVVAFNKSDLGAPPAAQADSLAARGVPSVPVSAVTGAGLDDLRRILLEASPAGFFDDRPMVADLVGPGGLAVLVVPIDKEAPRGRLIQPQVQAIRDLLDHDSICMVVKERDLRSALGVLRVPPKLVVTDSQAFLEVARDTPEEIPLTSFSILMARLQGDLVEQSRGAAAIESLKKGDRILVAEACTHHPIGDDIGRVKIPRWLNRYTGEPLLFDQVQGRDFPEDLSPYALVIHCGNCMGNRREMLSRILRCRAAGVPVTNYGVAIALSLGILERALGPFPRALEAFLESPRRIGV